MKLSVALIILLSISAVGVVKGVCSEKALSERVQENRLLFPAISQSELYQSPWQKPEEIIDVWMSQNHRFPGTNATTQLAGCGGIRAINLYLNYRSGNTNAETLLEPSFRDALVVVITGEPSYLTVTPSIQSVPGGAGNTTFTVTTNSSWSAVSDQGWCFVSPGGGTGNGNITAMYTANTTSAERTANIVVTSAGLPPVVVTVTQEPLLLTVSPLTQSVPGGAGNTTFTVTTNSSWSAVSDQGWCFVSPGGGTGNGNITAMYTPNMTSAERTANITVTVAGLPPVVVTITQEPLILTVSPFTQSVPGGAGNTTFTVTTNSSWSAVSDQGWCFISPGGGTGNGNITAMYTANTTSAERTANITVTLAGLPPVVVTVTQGPLILTISPLTQSIQGEAGNTSLAVTSNTTWTAGSDQSWCSISPTNGSGNENIEVTCTANGTSIERIAHITVTVEGLTPVEATVTQAPLILSVSPLTQSLPGEAGNTSFAVTSNTTWAAGSDQSWCSISPSNGSGTENIEVICTANGTSIERIAHITVTVEGLNPIEVTVTQAPLILSVSPLTQSIPGETGNTSFAVTSNTTWTAGSDQSWCSISPSTGSGNENIEVTCTANGTSIERIAQITVTVGGLTPIEVTVTQAPLILSVSPLTQSIPGEAGNTSFAVTSNTTWAAGSDQSWCSISPPNGNGNENIEVTCTANGTLIERIAHITVTVDGMTPVEVTVTQAPLILSVSPLTQSLPGEAGNTSFDVISNASWTAGSDQSWCSISPSNGNGNGTISVACSANGTSFERTAYITVTAEGLTPVILTLTQNGILNKTLNLTLFLEGLYQGDGYMHPAMDEAGIHWDPAVADKITVELHDDQNYTNLLFSVNNINLGIDGTATLTIPAVLSGSYYITVRHRNSIEVISSSPVSFSNNIINYSFNDVSKASGVSLLQIANGNWAIYGGDINQDGVVDTSDVDKTYYDASDFLTGYLTTDVNGDGIVDAQDIVLVDNNAALFIKGAVPSWCSEPFFTLPENGIDLVAGVESVLRGDALINVPIHNNLTLQYNCAIGIQTGNDFVIEPAEAGVFPLTIIFKNNGVVILTKTINLNVFEKVPANNIKLLRIGDSTIGGDEISQATQDVLSNCAVTFLGTQGDTYKNEGRSGYYFQTFVSPGSPFVKSGVLDIPAYFADNNIETPDYIDIRLGVNDMFYYMTTGFSDEEMNTVLGYAKTLITGFLNFDENLKVIMTFTSISENTGAGWNRNYPGNTYQDAYIRSIHKLWTGLKNEFDAGAFSNRVLISPGAIFLDRNDGYFKSGGVHSNGLHPNTAGLMQLGTGLGLTLNSEGAKAVKPTSFEASWEGDHAKINFVDQTNGVCTHEIWQSINGSAYSLVTTLPAGTSIYNDYTAPGTNVSFKIRARYGVWVSEFTSEFSL